MIMIVEKKRKGTTYKYLLIWNFKEILQKLEENEMTKKKCSIRSWLWQQYLSQHGNCSLCERPLNGLHEVSEFQISNIKTKKILLT